MILKEPDTTSAWYGYRPVTPDGMPYIGGHAEFDNLYYAGGHAMLGVSAAAGVLHVPYKGTAPFVNDLVAGRLQMGFTGAPAVIPHVRSGPPACARACRAPQRSAHCPSVPTVAESGYPGFEADQWYGIAAPARHAGIVVARLNAEINKALACPT